METIVNKVERTSEQKTVYAYYRTSTTDQTLDQQRAAVRSAYPDGIRIKEFHEQLSGWTGKRPEYEMLKNCIVKNWVKELAVFSVSRLGRNVQEAARFIELCQRHSVGVKCITEGLDFSGAMGYALWTLFAALAQMESDVKSAAIRAKFKQKREKDGWQCHGSPPHCLAEKVIGKAPEVYRMLDDGQSQKYIARQLELTESTVTKLVRRRGLPLWTRKQFSKLYPGWQKMAKDELRAITLEDAVKRYHEVKASDNAA